MIVIGSAFSRPCVFGPMGLWAYGLMGLWAYGLGLLLHSLSRKQYHFLFERQKGFRSRENATGIDATRVDASCRDGRPAQVRRLRYCDTAMNSNFNNAGQHLCFYALYRPFYAFSAPLGKDRERRGSVKFDCSSTPADQVNEPFSTRSGQHCRVVIAWRGS
jgi:hypothetical protein